MSDIDVRDVGGRLERLGIAVVFGVVVSATIADLLPQTSSGGWGAGAWGLSNPVLIAAGACGIASLVYAVLTVIVRRSSQPRRSPLPRARVIAR